MHMTRNRTSKLHSFSQLPKIAPDPLRSPYPIELQPSWLSVALFISFLLLWS